MYVSFCRSIIIIVVVSSKRKNKSLYFVVVVAKDNHIDCIIILNFVVVNIELYKLKRINFFFFFSIYKN